LPAFIDFRKFPTFGACLLGLLATLAIACGDSGQDEQPRPGTWIFTATQVTRNTCNHQALIPTNATIFTVSAVDWNGVFQIQMGSGLKPWSCEMDGKAFECPEQAAPDVDILGLEATMAVLWIWRGAFVNSTEMTGELSGNVGCYGVECTQAAQNLGTSFPCSFTAQFQARLQY
jgi:hypothetical protein